MKKAVIIALICILIGVIIAGIALTLMKFDFEALTTSKVVENKVTISEPFEDIRIDSKSAEVTLCRSRDGKTSVVTRCSDYEDCTVTVTDRTLEILFSKDEQTHLEINGEASEITVYLPEDTYGTLTVNCSSGDMEKCGDTITFEEVQIVSQSGGIELNALNVENGISVSCTSGETDIENVSCANLTVQTQSGAIDVDGAAVSETVSLSSASGEICAENLSCGEFRCVTQSGKQEFENVAAGGLMSVSAESGDVEAENCSAASYDFSAKSGSITGRLPNGTAFDARSDSGTVNVPFGNSESICRITTSSGNIKFD